MRLPLDDWQFWVVTAVAAAAALYVLRRILPDRLRPGRRKRSEKSATLTIGGKSPKKQ